jgi:sirohydrochlorin cobaltochelatase
MLASQRFRQWLRTAGSPQSPCRMGEVLIFGAEGEDFNLRHGRDRDVPASTLRPILSEAAWREMIRSTAEGDFRPLKAAPNLPSGWRYEGLDLAGLGLALQHLYPAALANWHRSESGELIPTPWEETAARQTGRFKIVARLVSGPLADLVATTCAQGCLKRRLWEPLDPPPPAWASDGSKRDEPEIPLLCPEACNWFVSKARDTFKPGGTEEAE